MNIAGDLHTHTVACGHALGTVAENLAQARRLHHRFLAITEHCGAVPGAPHPWFFHNLMRMPREVDGVVVIYGAEANVVDRQGNVDLPEYFLAHLDLVVASAHLEAFTGDRTDPDYTDLYCALAANPHVDIIGHSGDPRFSHDCRQAVRAYRDHNKIVEINASSPVSRKGSEPICLELVRLCKEYGVKVALSSDAHCPQNVGAVSRGAALLEEADFPEELVVNASYESLKRELHARRGLILPH